MTQHLLGNKRCALFCGCGLGKTAAVLDAINQLYADFATRGVLVIAPLRVCNVTWPSEVLHWSQFRWMKVANLRTTEGMKALRERSAQIYVVNYDSLQSFAKNYLLHCIKNKVPLAFDTVVYDELTKFKNHRSKRAKAVVPMFLSCTKRIWGLTGTPTPDSLLDIFAQVRAIDGGERLGKSFGMFRQTYFRATDYMEYNWVPREGAREQIYARLKDFALTIKSSDYSDRVPDIVEEDVEITLPEGAREKYEILTRELLLVLEGEGDVTAKNAAVLSNKLLQITSGAVYLEGEREGEFAIIHALKDIALDKIIADTDGPVLVACSYRHEIERVRANYQSAVVFSDYTKPEDQMAIVAEWNAGKIPILVAHPASIGHGLNLQAGGCTVVWRGLTWSRELYDQFNARVARRGQTKTPKVYRIISQDTIDYAVVNSLSRKEEEQTKLLDALKEWAQVSYKP
jgi:SNF2 family DNA or RNA helicase